MLENKKREQVMKKEWKKGIPLLKEVSRVPVRESGEPMVVIPSSSDIKVQYKKTDMVQALGKRMYVRKTLVHMLERVQRNIQKTHMQLWVVYGYRSPDVQGRYHQAQLQEVTKKHGIQWSDDQIREEAHRRSANPRFASHPSGAAVDGTLWNTKTRSEIDMGCAVCDFGDASYFNYPKLTIKQKKNRTFLQKIMKQVGFAPFLGEWWHFSYGDREWAMYYNKSCAVYDTVSLEEVKKAMKK